MNKKQNFNNPQSQQLNIADFMRSVLSEITDTCIYLRGFQSKAKEDGNKDKVIAYETCISHFEEMEVTLSGLMSEFNKSKINKISKQSEAKEKQGFLKKSPTCSNCINFSSEKEQYKTQWSSQEFTREFNLRCKIGDFKVGKSNWCTQHNFNDSNQADA